MFGSLLKILTLCVGFGASGIVSVATTINDNSSIKQDTVKKAYQGASYNYRVYKYDLFGVELWGSGIDQYLTLSDMSGGVTSFDFIYEFDGQFENDIDNNPNYTVVNYTEMAFSFDVTNNHDTSNYSSLVMKKLAISDGYTWFVLYDQTNNIAFKKGFSIFRDYGMSQYGFVQQGNVTVTELRPYAFIDFFSYALNLGGGQITTFDFADKINYYAPYQQDISANFVEDSTMINNSDIRFFYYDMPWFTSGGYLFNRIRVQYQNAISLKYYNNDNNIETWSSTGCASYQFIFYENTFNNHLMQVNTRQTEANDGQIIQIRSSSWYAQSFRNLTLYGELSPNVRVSLESFNNNVYGEYFGSVTNNVYLGQAVDLIRLAVTGMIPFMNIAILPGITIGVLLLVPFVVTLIITIVKLFKK